ncbi:MAG TPA: TonB family protein [Longimicrobiaceae bacterium]
MPVPRTARSPRTLFASLALAAALGAAAPAGLAAQDKVYEPAELTTAPKVKSATAAAAAVESSFPTQLRSIGGRVQLQFVVDPSGRVDPGSVEVVVASATALGEAAKKAVQRIAFTPGMVDGRAVPARVRFPIVYQAR